MLGTILTLLPVFLWVWFDEDLLSQFRREMLGILRPGRRADLLKMAEVLASWLYDNEFQEYVMKLCLTLEEEGWRNFGCITSETIAASTEDDLREHAVDLCNSIKLLDVPYREDQRGAWEKVFLSSESLLARIKLFFLTKIRKDLAGLQAKSQVNYLIDQGEGMTMFSLALKTLSDLVLKLENQIPNA